MGVRSWSDPDSVECGTGSLSANLGNEPRTVKPPVQLTHICFSSSRLWVSSSRTRFCSARVLGAIEPMFPARDRARPSAMRGPVLAPPCTRHHYREMRV